MVRKCKLSDAAPRTGILAVRTGTCHTHEKEHHIENMGHIWDIVVEAKMKLISKS